MDDVDVRYHGAPELRVVDRDGGDAVVRPERVPDAVRARLDDGARRAAATPAGVEIRFVGDGPVTLKLSAPDGATVRTFWGPFRHLTFDLGPDVRPITLRRPARIAALDGADVDAGGFAPAVGRVAFGGEGPVHVHGVSTTGVRPPEPGDTPARTLLAYGTSITQGVGAGAPHRSYAAVAARRLGLDCLNLGFEGAGGPDPAMASYVADATWDVALVEPAANAVGRVDPDAFRERLTRTLDTVAGGDRPVVVVGLLPGEWDLPGADPGVAAAADRLRGALADAVADTSGDAASFLPGPDLLDVAGLSADLVHPSDVGATTLGERVAARVAPLPFDGG
jgi:lysophospholipase L1-like esterase